MMNELKHYSTAGRTGFQPVHGLACGCAIVIAMCASSAWAMPTEDELNQVRPLVKEIMAEHSNAYRANKKTAKEVGDAAFGHVNDAEGEAAKYLLLRGAINYYTRAREFDKAADVLEAMQSQIRELPASDVEALALKALNNARRNDNVQRLRTIYRGAAIHAKAENEINSFKAALRKNDGDTAALRGLADAYARAGNWPKSLEMFAKLGNTAAVFELNPANAKDYDALKAADFWWYFKSKDTAPYHAHAAALYRRALDEGLVKGLVKVMVDKRIAEVETSAGGPRSVAAVGGRVSSHAAAAGDSRRPSGKLYCVIDLSSGPQAMRNYPVSYLDAKPESGWTDEYKTTKLVLRRIEPGTFIMGRNQRDESYRVTLSEPFYIGVFEVTQKQYELVTGNKPSKYPGDMRPVDTVSYEMLRGRTARHDWPKVKTVDSDTFIGRIRKRTGMDGFDLPTQAQWEYACRAGTTTDRYDGSMVNGKNIVMIF